MHAWPPYGASGVAARFEWVTKCSTLLRQVDEGARFCSNVTQYTLPTCMPTTEPGLLGVGCLSCPHVYKMRTSSTSHPSGHACFVAVRT
jgi:hypothetical protein